MATPVHRLSVAEKVGFGDLASNLFWQMFAIFIAVVAPWFYDLDEKTVAEMTVDLTKRRGSEQQAA